MRTAASVKGHPIHVMLIPFPIAFLVGAVVSDLVAASGGPEVFAAMAGWLAAAGIATGLAAAVPGGIDYFRSVPPNSSARTRATRHAVANLSAITLFAGGLWLRGGIDAVPTTLSLGLWAFALVGLTMGGWMGGTLAFRNQIGVDHRYAGAGRWREERVPAGNVIVLARTDELDVDQMKLVHVGGRRIVVARTDEGYVAFDDRCTHRGASLADGAMICGTVQCPWHGSQFDVRDGAVKAGPAEGGIETWSVEVVDGQVRLMGERAP